MEIRLIGDARDTTGFGLAGIDGAECRTPAEVARALERWRADPDVAIVIVTATVAALAPDEITRQRRTADGPILVVLE